MEKSNNAKKPRCLTLNGKCITWKVMKDAYDWDQASFTLPLHEKLTPQHLELDPASRMRNHLAEDVLDRKMLFLMQVIHSLLSVKLVSFSDLFDISGLQQTKVEKLLLL